MNEVAVIVQAGPARGVRAIATPGPSPGVWHVHFRPAVRVSGSDWDDATYSAADLAFVDGSHGYVMSPDAHDALNAITSEIDRLVPPWAQTARKQLDRLRVTLRAAEGEHGERIG